MIVYNLACDQQHPFEGWFASPADFENQRDRGLVECPLCGSNKIERKLHAPRINMGAQPVAAGAAASADAAVPAANAVTDANSGGPIDLGKLEIKVRPEFQGRPAATPPVKAAAANRTE